MFNASGSVLKRPAIAILAMLFAGATSGCSNEPTEPAPGSLRVGFQTTGGDLDEDGYELIAASRQWVVNSGSFVVIDGVPVGPQLLEVRGIATNCTLDGDNPRSVMVETGATTDATFAVACEATGIRVSTTTSGTDYPPLGYGIRRAGDSYLAPANGSVVITRVPPGSHTIELTNVPSNCTVKGSRSLTVNVTLRSISSAAFDVECIRGTRIAFGVDSITASSFARLVAITSTDGSGVPTIVAGGIQPAWSPDGSRLAYSNTECDYYYYYEYGCSGGIVILDLTTLFQIAPANALTGNEPAWSPDGKVIAFIRYDPNDATIHLADLTGPSAKLAIPGASAVYHPAWSPDGRRLAFQCWYNSVSDICLIGKDGTGFARLSTTGNSHNYPAWSPDGSRIAFSSIRGGAPWVAHMTPEGTDVTALAPGWDPEWSADGSRLVFARTEGLFTMNADGSNIVRITTGRHRDPTWRK